MSLLQLQDTRFCKIHTHLYNDGNHGQRIYVDVVLDEHFIQRFTQLDIQEKMLQQPMG